MLRRSVALAFVLCLVGAACSTSDDANEDGGDGSASGEPIVIGFPADLSTDWAAFDSPMEEGAQFAVDQINEEGGVLGRPLELKTVDMRNDVAEAAKVTQQLIDDGSVYLIGTVGDGILAEGQVACATGVPISTGLGTAPSLVGDMGECAYQLVMSDNIQAAVLAEYAIAEGYETAYVLGSNEIPYTRDLPTFFSDAFENGGGTVVGHRRVQARRRRLLRGRDEDPELRPRTRRDLHADVHPRQRGLPPPAPSGRGHHAGALDRRQRRRRRCSTPASRRSTG